MVRLTAELISQGAQFMNPVKDYELDLRGTWWYDFSRMVRMIFNAERLLVMAES